MEEKKLSRREREKLQQRRHMLEAALELFSERGYHNVSMHEIAERSEFAIGTLYRFFKNKEDLYRALVLEKSTQIFNALSEPLSGDRDTLKVLKGYLENRGRISAEIAPLLRLHMAIAPGLRFNINDEVEKEHRRLHEKHIRKLAAVMEEGIRRKVLRALDPLTMAVALDGLTRSIFLCSAKDPKRHPYEAGAPLILDLFLHGGEAKRKARVNRAS